MKLEKSNPDTFFFFGAEGSISEPSESEWLRDTEAEERGGKNERIFLLIILFCLAKS